MAKRTSKKKDSPEFKILKKHVLVMRTCDKDLRSKHNGFQYPASGPVEAPDWQPTPACGHGLHGFLWGEGDAAGLADWSEDAKWLVVAVDPADGLVEIDGNQKCKFRKGHVVFAGDLQAAASLVQAHAPAGKKIVGGTAKAGDMGTATAGDRGTATAGYRGTATAGDMGTATAGDSGTAKAGDSGTAKAGDRGTIVIQWWDAKREKYRPLMGEIGENGLEPDVAYRVEDGKFVKAGA